MSSTADVHSVNPWEDREDRGTLRAFFETAWWVVRRPRQLYASTRAERGLKPPLAFGVLVSLAGFVVEGVILSLLHLLFPDVVPAEMAPETPVTIGALELSSLPGWMISAIGCQATFLVAPVIVLVYTLLLLLWAGIIHAGLLMLRGRARTDVGFAGTMGAVGYAVTASLAQIVPLAGDLVFVTGTVVLTAIGLQEIHGASRGKSLAAASLPILLIIAMVLTAAAL